MKLSDLTSRAGEWLRGNGPMSEIVISSRIRLARNIAGHRFLSRASRTERNGLTKQLSQALLDNPVQPNSFYVNLDDAPEIDRQLLVERHLISKQHATNEGARGVFVSGDESVSIMVNEEDHLRIQCLRSGLQLDEAWQQINAIDDQIEARVPYAFHPRFGYLTACPTNVGTGIRVSVMLHLPALKLTGEIEKVRRAARDMHLAVRGLFGEGSDALGDLYQVSNQTTLGRSEPEILADFPNTVVPQIIAYEQQARQALLRQRAAQLDDKVWRAWALLTHARVIGTEEVLGLLSHLRLGVNLGRLDTVDIRTINELFLLTQPAHLQRITGREMDPAARREARAQLIRQKLKAR
jgi:protein arginine kinase